MDKDSSENSPANQIQVLYQSLFFRGIFLLYWYQKEREGSEMIQASLFSISVFLAEFYPFSPRVFCH